MPHYTLPIHKPSGRNSPKPPPAQYYSLSDPPYRGQLPTDTRTYAQTAPSTAIVIDNGSSTVRAGWQHESTPRLQLPPLMARYTDRKLNRKLTFVGSEIYFDGTARGQSKNIYEPGSDVVNNWDVQEGVLDYVFLKLGISGRNGHIDRPVVMTEPLANPGYSRKVMSEILFELYGVPSVAYGIDSLFSYNHNGGKTGLVVSSANMSTHLIPVVNQQPLITHATRLDWGRNHCVEYLKSLLKAKYPGVLTTSKVTDTQLEDLIQQHCHISLSYDAEITRMLDWSGLEERSHVIQLPYVEKEIIQKSEEELRRAEEKRREGGRRLQEQAAKMRLEKLIRKEEELEYLKDLHARVSSATTKKEARAILDEDDDFKDEAALDRKIKEMEKSIRKQRNRDVGDDNNNAEDAPADPPSYPLLEIPDDQLDDEGLKAKRQQRLLKANHDARARAKAEKEAEKARRAALQAEDDAYRERDLESWLADRRGARMAAVQKIKDRDRLKADLGNRKSQAAQQRMKTLTSLAADEVPGRKRRRGRNEDEDFGDDAEAWNVYREITVGKEGFEDEEENEEEDLAKELKILEADLLKYDPEFSEESTRDAQSDWTRSLVHCFSRGGWGFDPESAREGAQMHLNVERIRVPEVVFQPGLAGVDQAGLVEIAEDVVMQRLGGNARVREGVLRDVFVTGGYTMFEGFEERLKRELRAVLPVDVDLGIRRAKDPILDAWKGAAGWASREESRKGFVSKEEWAEKGGEYIKEHNLGNAFS